MEAGWCLMDARNGRGWGGEFGITVSSVCSIDAIV